MIMQSAYWILKIAQFDLSGSLNDWLCTDQYRLPLSTKDTKCCFRNTRNMS